MAQKNVEKASEQPAQQVSKKDPSIALILALVGGLIFGILPGIGHIYMGLARKGIIYCGISILLWGLIAGGYIVLSFTVVGMLCFPILFIPYLFNLAVVYDLYKITKGEQEFLPNF